MYPQFAVIDPTPTPVFLVPCSASTPLITPCQLTPVITTDVAPIPPPTPAQLDPMEALWHTQFDLLFNNFWPSKWQLFPQPLVDYPVTNWHSHSDAAKVRFLCEICGHGWTSMKGRVMFWYSYDPNTLCGIVVFSLFGQKCQECSRQGLDTFTSSMWYQEEVVKVLYNVYNHVGQTYYGFQQPPYVKIRRPGKPRSQHAAELCQACQMGICASSAALTKDENGQEIMQSHSSNPTDAYAVIQANKCGMTGNQLKSVRTR